MAVHVIAARIYTGEEYCLGKITTGLLGGWYKQLEEAEQFPDSAKADRVFDALISYLVQPPMGRSLFDPWVLRSLYERARVVEFTVATPDGKQMSHSRRRTVNLVFNVDPLRNPPSLKLAVA